MGDLPLDYIIHGETKRFLLTEKLTPDIIEKRSKLAAKILISKINELHFTHEEMVNSRIGNFIITSVDIMNSPEGVPTISVNIQRVVQSVTLDFKVRLLE